MKDPEGFLSRWSRRKRATADLESEQQFELQVVPGSEGEIESPPRDAEDATKGAEEKEREEKEKEEEIGAFDISKLPSIESITAETDIRAFLAPGVPPELTQAALRRVWVMDPKIRDFIEVAENQWDFTVTGGAPGFDLSAPVGDIAQMLKQILPRPADESGEEGPQPADAQAQSPQAELPSASFVSPRREDEDAQDSNPEPARSASREIAQVGEEDIALQKDDAMQDQDRPTRRRGHGGAMPR